MTQLNYKLFEKFKDILRNQSNLNIENINYEIKDRYLYIDEDLEVTEKFINILKKQKIGHGIYSPPFLLNFHLSIILIMLIKIVNLYYFIIFRINNNKIYKYNDFFKIHEIKNIKSFLLIIFLLILSISIDYFYYLDSNIFFETYFPFLLIIFMKIKNKFDLRFIILLSIISFITIFIGTYASLILLNIFILTMIYTIIISFNLDRYAK